MPAKNKRQQKEDQKDMRDSELDSDIEEEQSQKKDNVVTYNLKDFNQVSRREQSLSEIFETVA